MDPRKEPPTKPRTLVKVGMVQKNDAICILL